VEGRQKSYGKSIGMEVEIKRLGRSYIVAYEDVGNKPQVNEYRHPLKPRKDYTHFRVLSSKILKE
jgi:hypothetical protein